MMKYQLGQKYSNHRIRLILFCVIWKLIEKGLREIGSKLDFNLIEYLFCDSANVHTYIHLKISASDKK